MSHKYRGCYDTCDDSSLSTEVWCTVTSQAQDPTPHSLITPSSPAEASLPRHSTTAFTADVCPSKLRAQVQVPGLQTMILPSSEQLTTLLLHTQRPLKERKICIKKSNNLKSWTSSQIILNRMKSDWIKWGRLYLMILYQIKSIEIRSGWKKE